MKTLVAVIFLCIVIPPAALSASDKPINTNDQGKVTPSSVYDVANPSLTAHPTSPSVRKESEERETSQDYEAAMVAITQKFSVTLGAIAEGVQQGRLSSEQGKEMSAELYQLAQMQFELLSVWREIEEADSARMPDAQTSPGLTQEHEIVTVALPFSSLELNPSLADYLSLTRSQIEAIQQVMARERESLRPLMAQIRTTSEKLVAIDGDQTTEKEVKALAEAQATLVAKLIIANARMQSKIYRVLNPDQRQKLSDLERTQGSAINEGHEKDQGR